MGREREVIEIISLDEKAVISNWEGEKWGVLIIPF